MIEIEKVIAALKPIYEEKLPFNKLLGLTIESMSVEHTVIKIAMREELVGNFEKKILHGGVISSVLDFTGGVIAQMQVLQDMLDSSVVELTQRLTQMGTIDLRVDYIRPGKGTYFLATGKILRLGHKVAVVRTEFVNDEGILIAAGTETYLVS